MNPVGLMGAGVMGLTAGRKIVGAGYGLLIYDPSSAAQEKARDMGAIVGGSPAEVASKTDVVLMFLPGPEDVKSAVIGSSGLLTGAHDGMVIVDMSTVDPITTESMASAARKKGVGYLDAPVLGRPAAVGNWALPVGGRDEDLRRVRSILELFAGKIFHIGESGTGNKIKLLNQMMFGAINAMTAEMMAIADRMGIAPKTLYETITASQAGTVSNLFKELGARIAEDNYEDPTFTVDLLIKDVRLGLEMAKGNDAPPVLGSAVQFLNEMAHAQGLGGKDTAVMWKGIRRIWEKM